MSLQRSANITTDAQATNSAKPSASQQQEQKYFVIVRNVENDLSVIHRYALPRFLCLDPSAQREASPAKLPAPAGPSGGDDESVPHYIVSVRTETKSAQMKFFGNGSCFLPARLRAANQSDEDEPPQNLSEHVTRPQPTRGTKRRRTEDVATDINSAEDLAKKYRRKRYFSTTLRFRAGSDFVPQRALVTAEAACSAPLSTQQLESILVDLPGYLNCWRISGRAPGTSYKRCRVAFASHKHLFQAKALLDEFSNVGEVEDGPAEGVTISISLPDGFTDAFQSYLLERAEAVDAAAEGDTIEE